MRATLSVAVICFVQVLLELVEGPLDLLRGATAFVDLADAFLDVDAGFQGAEHFVGGPEHAVEELELLVQKLEDPLVGLVGAVDEVDDHHVVLLAVPVATTDALLDPLRVPRQVVVHHERAELEVHAFRGGLGGNHDRRPLGEFIDQSGTHVGRRGAADALLPLVPLEPILVHLLRGWDQCSCR